MPTATQSTVILNRAQRSVCCKLIEEEFDVAATAAFVIEAGRFYEAMDWDNKDNVQNEFVLHVDERILNLTRRISEDLVDEYARPFVDQDRDEYCRAGSTPYEDLAVMFDLQYKDYQALIEATDMILAVA